MRRIPLALKLLPGARRNLRRLQTDVSGWSTGSRRAKTAFHNAQASDLSGAPRIGAQVVDGVFLRFAQRLDVAPDQVWTTPLPSIRFAEWLHGFEWLYDLHALGTAEARHTARRLVDGWVEQYSGYHSFTWRTDILARRVLAQGLVWSPLLNTDDLSDLADARRQSHLRQSRFLARNTRRVPPGLDTLRALSALVVTGLRTADASDLASKAQAHLSDALAAQIMPDGGHISRSPESSVATWSILKPLDSLLEARGRPAISAVSRALDRVGPIVGFFTHLDGGLATFHGSGEGDIGTIGDIAATVGAKPFAFAPHAHFQRMMSGDTLVIVDVGAPAPFPHDRSAHISPLAFEMSTLSGRLVVACGYSDEQPQRWREPVRALAAHSALCLDDADAARMVSRDKLGLEGEGHHILRGPSPVRATRREAEPGTLVEGSHQGFVKTCGLVHTRRLFLSSDGNDLRGEDKLEVAEGSVSGFATGQPVSVRFHLAPDVLATVSGDARHVVITHGEETWVFLLSADAFRIELEESAYLGTGSKPRKTRQIVVRGQATGSATTLRWAFRKRTNSIATPQ